MDVTGDAVMTTWTRTSEERFQHLVGPTTPRTKAVLEVKGVQPGTPEVELMKWQLAACVH